jgi:hypothetical protein
VIYLDSSVALAQILNEARCPPPEFWLSDLTSSRLLAFEVTNRVHAYDPGPNRLAVVGDLLRIVDLVEMSERTLSRALRAFPLPVRTLDGLHLATMDYLRSRGAMLTLASYDARLLAAADAMGFDSVQP